MAQLFLQYVVPILATVLTTLAGRLIHAWTEKHKETTSAQFVNKVIILVSQVVSEVEQTIRPQLVNVLNKGTLSAEDKLLLRDTARAKLKTYLTPGGIVKLVAATGIRAEDVEEYLITLIEDTVAGAKR